MADVTPARLDAIRRFLQGEPASAVCRSLGRTRDWLCKWLKRSDPAHAAWCQDHSRAPHRVGSKTPAEAGQLACKIRQRLVTTKDAPRGALTIRWQLQQLGAEPLPELWTIKRSLKRHGLVAKRASQARGTPYPAWAAHRPNAAHRLALAGPRSLKGGERFSGLHLIDAQSKAVALAAVPRKQASDVAEARVAGWQRLGVPRALQVDNAPAFRGANRHPRGFGLLIRPCLDPRVAVHFIAAGEPGRNGIVERCNDVYAKLFCRPQPFRDRAHRREELPSFETFHNPQHRAAKRGSRTPWEGHTAAQRRLLSRRLALHPQGLPWREGRVSCTRLTDDQGRVRFFSETLPAAPTLVHADVRGTIDTPPGVLRFRHHDRTVRVHPYTGTKP
jgi:putative transposase